jgi:hypothetical protein
MLMCDMIVKTFDAVNEWLTPSFDTYPASSKRINRLITKGTSASF